MMNMDSIMQLIRESEVKERLRPLLTREAAGRSTSGKAVRLSPFRKRRSNTARMSWSVRPSFIATWGGPKAGTPSARGAHSSSSR